MNRSFQLAIFKGIPVKVHWTFGLIILFILFVSFESNTNTQQIVFFFLAFIALFICVILHEFGHALIARHFGVQTRDIIISPIGGVARLESLPEKAIEEFYIAIGGPAVNVIIAIGLSFAIILWLDENPFHVSQRFESVDGIRNLVVFMLQINIALFLFNLIPAFPMDGGRILRSLLSMKIGRMKSTKIASWIGRLIAVLFVIIGIIKTHIILSVIGVFIYYMARQEYRMIRMEEKLKSTLLHKIMRKQFTQLKIVDPMSIVFETVTNNNEDSFLVFDHHNQAVGILHPQFIRMARQKNAFLEPVAYYTSDKLYFLDMDSTIEEARNLMQEKGLSIIGIKQNSNIAGVVDRRDIIRFMKQAQNY